MNKLPQVSIALCTYNGAKFLEQQLDTLVNQTYKNIEIVVVDDCSTDGTLVILNKYAIQYPQFQVYQNKNNLGFTRNFEKVVNLCKGDLIALCDQDDIWHPQKIELQVNAISDNVLIYHDSEFIHEDGSSMNKKMSDVMNLYSGNHPQVFFFFNCVSGHSILMKRELLAVSLPLKEDYFHDWWLAYVATNIGSIDYLPQCLVKYRQHDKSDTNILRLKRKKEIHKFSSVNKLRRTYQWLAHCVSFDKNRDQKLIEQFYDAFTVRMHKYVSLKLSILLFNHRNLIFFIRKKSKVNRLNYIYSQIWGLRIKEVLSNNSDNKG